MRQQINEARRTIRRAPRSRRAWRLSARHTRSCGRFENARGALKNHRLKSQLEWEFAKYRAS